jgi:hypothetical protein
VKFFANKLNGNFLRNVLPGPDIEVDWVRAAIAYGSDSSTLIDNCISNHRRLDIWMRYDHTVPVAPSLLKKLLQSTNQNIFCYLIPDVHHAKVIWWKNHGVYIGSANLTDRAWITNIEFGVFIPENDLEVSGEISEIELFFDFLENCDAAFELNDEIVKEQEKIWALRNHKEDQLNREAEAIRKIKRWEGPAYVTSKIGAKERQKENFISEWRNGLTILKSIAEIAPTYRPSWLNKDVPAAWQADQFLHAYYYNEVVDGVKHPFEDYYQKNKNDPARALKNALKWWSQLKEPPSSEDENCHVRAPLIQRNLSVNGLSSLTFEQFTAICRANHSTVDHVRRMTFDELGITLNENSDCVDRVEAFSNLIWPKRNARGESITDLLRFVLDGGPKDELPTRIFEAARASDRKFPHLGTNQFAELAGWARPDMCPPRNGRTSKGLRALGYDVRVF